MTREITGKGAQNVTTGAIFSTPASAQIAALGYMSGGDGFPTRQPKPMFHVPGSGFRVHVRGGSNPEPLNPNSERRHMEREVAPTSSTRTGQIPAQVEFCTGVFLDRPFVVAKSTARKSVDCVSCHAGTALHATALHGKVNNSPKSYLSRK